MKAHHRLHLWLGGTALVLLACSAWALLRPDSTPERAPLELTKISRARVTAGEEVELFGTGFDGHTRAVLYQDMGHRRAIRHTIDTGGLLESVTVAGDLLFLANNYRGMQIFDCSDPTRPRQLATLDTPGKALKIAVGGELAYLVDREEGLQIIDAVDPEKLKLLGSLRLEGLAIDISVDGDRLYIANARKGLQVVDVADPAQPRLLASLPLSGPPIALALQGKYAYVATSQGGGLSIVDLADPARPQLVGTLPSPHHLLGVTVRGHLAYLAAGAAGLLIADVGRPAQPRLLSSLPLAGVIQKSALAGSRLYLAAATGGLRVIDVADPSRPQSIGFYGLPGHSRSVALAQGYALVATGRDGLQVVDLAYPPDPRPPLFWSDSRFHDILQDQGQLALAAGLDGVILLDFDPSGAPRRRGSVGNGGSAWKLVGRDDFLYVISGDPQQFPDYHRKKSLLVIDAGDRQQPVITAALPAPEGLNGLVVHGSHLLAATGQGLAIFSLADPRRPRQTALLPLPLAAKCLALLGDHVLVYNARGSLQVIDLRDPEAPHLIGTAPIPWTLQPFALGNEMAVDGDLALVADGRNGLLVFQVGNRRQPRLVGVCQLPKGGLAVGATLVDRHAYVTDSRHGVHLIDLNVPESPQRVATLANASWAKRIVLREGKILLAQADLGLTTLPLPVEIEEVRLRNGDRLTLRLPADLPPGDYTVRLFNPWSSAELPGALRIEN